MSCALCTLFYMGGGLPFNLFSFKPLFCHAAESAPRLKNAVRGQTDEVCAAQDLSSHSGFLLEADSTPCDVNDASLGVSQEAVAVKWRTLPLFLLAPLGQLTGSHCWHGKQTRSGMV